MRKQELVTFVLVAHKTSITLAKDPSQTKLFSFAKAVILPQLAVE
jgi:hypothetical protein